MLLPRVLFVPMLLGGCALRPATAPAVDVQIHPSSDSVFNIVWLRTSLHNRGPQRVWV